MQNHIHVFKVQDGDWIAARTAKQALNEQVRHTGERDYLLNEAVKLSDADLDHHCLMDEEFDDAEPVTFRFALERLLKANATFPRILATEAD